MSNPTWGDKQMLKNFLVSELKTMFGCTEDTLRRVAKKSFIYLMIYVVIMLLTFSIALAFTSNNAFILGSIFSFLLGIEMIILSIVVSLPIFLIFVYYGALFAYKGWKRHSVI